MNIRKYLTIVPAVALMAAAWTSDSSYNPNPGQVQLQIGKEVPDLEGNMPNGETMKLSDLRGQIVLIDFWASWCGPCRATMPPVVQAYNNYKDSEFEGGKGFAVFSVSLDQNMTAWKRGIENLGQVWPHHISDLRGWRSMHAAKYGVNAIPAAFLIDGEGRLIAKNIHPMQLNNTLQNLSR